MTDTTLQKAVTAIKAGDKATGKNLLLEVLEIDSENDKAWVWMSAVVDTDELRLECLEEALKFNPNNQTAQKGISKLQRSKKLFSDTTLPESPDRSPWNLQDKPQKAAGEIKSIAPIPLSPLTRDSQTTIEYFCKRLIIEKAYAVLALDETLTVPILKPETRLFPIPAEVVPELLPLQAHFDVILFRQTGAGFDVVCLKVCRSQAEPLPVTQAQLVDAGQACLKYSKAVAYGIVSPIKFQVWELYERSFTPDDAERLKALKRIPGRKHVGVQVHAIDKISRTLVYSSAWFKVSGNRRYLQHLLDQEATFSEEQLLTELVNSRIEPMPIIAGIVAGTALGLGLRLVAEALGWQYDINFDIFIVFFVAAIAVYLPKFKQYSDWQGALAAAGYGIVLYSVLVFLFNYEASGWYLFYLAIYTVIGRFVGVIVEP